MKCEILENDKEKRKERKTKKKKGHIERQKCAPSKILFPNLPILQNHIIILNIKNNTQFHI